MKMKGVKGIDLTPNFIVEMMPDL